jgi:hypothetical protein
MKLKLSPNLNLGLAELKFFQQSLLMRKFFSAFIEQFGVVKTVSPSTDLKVIQGAGNTVSIQAGIAIDSDFEVIDIPFLENHIAVPQDGVTRYIVVNYQETTTEIGTVQVQADGTVVSDSVETDKTKFTERFRGISNFSSKIKFPTSINNTGEYFVKSVIDDETLLLNVAQDVIIAESNLPYKVIGSFTPGVVVDDKYPFISDSYQIEIRDDNTLITGKEFQLASVNYNAGVFTIIDLRDTNRFLINRYLVEYSVV